MHRGKLYQSLTRQLDLKLQEMVVYDHFCDLTPEEIKKSLVELSEKAIEGDQKNILSVAKYDYATHLMDILKSKMSGDYAFAIERWRLLVIANSKTRQCSSPEECLKVLFG